MPTRAEWPSVMRRLAERRIELSTRKNANYAAGGMDSDAFHNFRLIEHVTHGIVTTEIGLLVRISDKFCRLAQLLTGTKDQVGESTRDTLDDLANYADILNTVMTEKEVNQFLYESLVNEGRQLELPLSGDTSDDDDTDPDLPWTEREVTKPAPTDPAPNETAWEQFKRLAQKGASAFGRAD